MKYFVFIVVFFFVHGIAFTQTATEKLETDWPVKNRWKLFSDNKDTINHILEYAPQNATMMLWDTLIYVQSIKNVIAPNLDYVISSYSKGALKVCPQATFTVLEKDERSKNFWVIYKVEAPNYPNDPVPESQLYFIIQGDHTFFMNFIAIKEKNLSAGFVEYWSKVFKESRLIKGIEEH